MTSRLFALVSVPPLRKFFGDRDGLRRKSITGWSAFPDRSKVPCARGFDESEGLRRAIKLPTGAKLVPPIVSGLSRSVVLEGEVEADLEG
jgi:hypothetical protein